MSTDPEQPRPVNDTPRTDAASETIYSDDSIFGRHIVDVDFARQLEGELNDWKSGARAESEALDKANRELAASLDRVKELMADNLKTENARLRSVLESIYNEGRGSEVFPPSPDDGHDGLKFLAVQQALNPSPNDTRH